MATLIIQRPSGYRSDRMRAYKIFIDNIEAGKIFEGQILNFDCSTGKHIVRFGIDWCFSKIIETNFETDESSSIVECWPLSNIFNALWKITFGRKSYIGAKLIEDNTNTLNPPLL